MATRHQRMINRAINVARCSQHRRWNLGAVAAKGSRVVGFAPNKYRNDPWINHAHATTHAEMAVLGMLGRSLRPVPGA